MRQWRKAGRPLLLAMGACVLAALGAAATAKTLPTCAVSNGATASYDIIRSGRVIGRHVVRFAIAGADMTVTTDVEASLSALGIRVYHYEHHGAERWHGGHMISIVTRTDDDGTVTKVDARLSPTDGTWHGTKGLAPGTAPLLASSLWNSLTLQQSRLLDHETGEVTAIRATPVGEETIQLGNRQVTALKSDMTGGTGGSVWYDDAGCWVKALFESPVDRSLIEVRAR